MELSPRSYSVFDNYYKLESPSTYFGWTSSHLPKAKKSDLICTSELQEVDCETSSIYTTRIYGATPTTIFRFDV